MVGVTIPLTKRKNVQENISNMLNKTKLCLKCQNISLIPYPVVRGEKMLLGCLRLRILMTNKKHFIIKGKDFLSHLRVILVTK